VAALVLVGLVAGAVTDTGQSYWLIMAGWIVVLFFLLATAGVYWERQQLVDDLAAAQEKRAVLMSLRPQPKAERTYGEHEDEDYFRSLVTINVTSLRDYYYLVKSHTGAGFRASILAAVIGFALVAAAVVFAYTHPNEESVALLAGGSGVLMQFISGVFFVLYSRTVRQLKAYHDSLLDVQDVLLSLKLVETVQDSPAKTEMLKALVTSLMSRERRRAFTNPDGDKGAQRPGA
jgi:hypothetical protein